MTPSLDELIAVHATCTRFVTHDYPRSPREQMLALAESIAPDELPDMYGRGEIITSFEARVAELLGKEAAVFMPSGTMAQQIALRIWCDRRGVRAVAMHPRNHLDAAEKHAYRWLHGLEEVLVGEAHALLTLEQLREVGEPLGALMLELPQRHIGGQLPTWDELVAIAEWARGRGIAMHMDGARLWESGPFYAPRSYAEIAALFDTVYVSFYKGLAGLAGSALAGPVDVIAEARVWKTRHGGNLIRLYPYVVAARKGLDEKLPRMAAYHEKAVAIAAALDALPGVVVVPNPPHAHMMHVFLHGDPQRLTEAHLAQARETGIWLFWRLEAGLLPNWGKFELSVGDASLDLPTDEIAALVAGVIERAG